MAIERERDKKVFVENGEPFQEGSKSQGCYLF